jgi:hypothetical protein
MKKKKRTDMPNGIQSREFDHLIGNTDPDELKKRILDTPRDILDRWVEEISGNKPDPSQETEFVSASLCRYIDGDKNWGDDPRRVENLSRKRKPVATQEGDPEEGQEGELVDAEWQEEVTTHTQAETPEGEEAMTTKKNGKKIATKKITKKKSVPPKPEKIKKEKKESTRLSGKSSGLTRMAWFLDILRKNREAKLTDEKIDSMAIAEFGAENIPGEKKTFTAAHMRSWFVYCAKHDRGGVKKSETFTAHNKE